MRVDKEGNPSLWGLFGIYKETYFECGSHSLEQKVCEMLQNQSCLSGDFSPHEPLGAGEREAEGEIRPIRALFFAASKYL